MLSFNESGLRLADAKKIAVGAFNITSLEGIQAVLGAAKELGQPVILQFAPVHESVIPLKVIGPVMVMMAEKSSVPVCVHLDHGDKLEILQEAFDYEQEEQRGPRIRLHTEAGYQEFYMQDICYFEYRDRKSGLWRRMEKHGCEEVSVKWQSLFKT